MSQHPEPEEWQRNGLGKEHPAYAGVDVGESIADASYNEVLKRTGLLHKGGPLLRRIDEAVPNKRERQLDGCRASYQHDDCCAGCGDLPRKGSACSTQTIVLTRPTCHMS